jgi:hypothetical protein
VNNGSEHAIAGWSGRRWTLTIVLVFAAHLAAVYLLGAKVVPTQHPEPSRLNFSLMTDASGRGKHPLTEPWESPTLLVLASAAGFSGKTWLDLPPPRHEAGGWDEPIKWLKRDTNSIARSLPELVSDSARNPRELLDRSPPRVEEDATAASILPANSTLRISGGLERRRLARPIELLKVAHNDVLTNTVIEAMVTPAGYVFSAAVLTSSQLKSVDQWALKRVREARFEAVPRGSPDVLGQFTFHWATIEPNATNTAVFRP